MNMAAVTRNLTKQFKDFWGRPKVTAVDNVSLSVPEGCVFGLLGPNGSGKTTTLKLLTGLLHPTDGDVMILNAKPHAHETRKRLGYLPEASSLYGSLTARQNLLFYAGLFGLSPATARCRADELLAKVNLSEAADRPVAEYSRGMNRRAGLAQALINDPDLLILDEPTAGLDPAGCRLVKDMIRSHALRGKTVIISSHLLADIEDICDSVCILHRGSAIASGRLDELLEHHERIRFTTDAVSSQQQAALQTAFREITGHVADVSHPRIALETFFFNAVSNASPKPEDKPASQGDGGDA